MTGSTKRDVPIFRQTGQRFAAAHFYAAADAEQSGV